MHNRRTFIRSLGFSSAFLAVPGAFAEAVTQTPGTGFGPFYPDHLPLDTDNDLITINEGLTPAIGEITYVSGRVLDPQGDPVRNAVVEIWQADAKGIYIHSQSGGDKAAADTRFQGYGRFLTGEKGEYLFRTIKPVSYPGRCPHVHFAIKMKGREKWTTQCYIKGEPSNEKDGVWRGIRDEKQRESVTVDFAALKDAKAGELAARFDIVMGFTPAV